MRSSIGSWSCGLLILCHALWGAGCSGCDGDSTPDDPDGSLDDAGLDATIDGAAQDADDDAAIEENPGPDGGADDAGSDASADAGPPEPTIPPGCDEPLDPTVATHFYDAVRCLFEGDDAVQTGVEDGALSPARIAVMRGHIFDEDGAPLPGVKVEVLREPQLGSTETRSDGAYDIALLGGGLSTLRFTKDGYLPVQRHQDAEWQDMVALADVVMLRVAPTATRVELAAMMAPAWARGARSTDESGSRTQKLLFQPGTIAQLEHEDGTLEPLLSIDVRAREYTVGPSGVAAMPGELPASSAYTYAVELTVDQAEEEGAKGVLFDPPVLSYVDNFLEFPAGTIVPVGYYDEERDAWEAMDSGVVLDIVSVDGGMAELDVDGDGEADDALVLAVHGITDDERAALAAEYDEGTSLWRVETPHFSAIDCNWPSRRPGDGPRPSVDPPAPGECETNRNGSIIGCEDQTLGEILPLSGTPFSLHYQSERTEGREDWRVLEITPTPDPALMSDLVKRIDLEISVLGETTRASLPADPNARYTYRWNGEDPYGRRWQGRQKVRVRVGYVYDSVYERTDRFGRAGTGEAVNGEPSRQEMTVWTGWRGQLGDYEQRPEIGFGGWSLDVHHVYDPRGRALWLGDGTRRTAERIGNVIDTVAGTGQAGFDGDGGPALEALIDSPHGIEIAPDGSVFVSDEDNHRIRKIWPSGVITTYAGTGVASETGDGGPATEATLDRPLGITLAPDGTLYIGTRGGRVRAVDPKTGIIRTAAGGGTPDDGRGDGGLATDAAFLEPHAFAFGSDGSLLIVDAHEHTLRRVAPDGIIETLAGIPGMPGSSGDGGRAALATINNPLGVAAARDGTIYIAEFDGHRVRKIDPSGNISTFAGTGAIGFSGDGGPATAAQLRQPHSVAVGPDGSVFITDEGNRRVRKVGPDGKIETIAGGGPTLGDGGIPIRARFEVPRFIYYHGDGSLWIADYNDQRIRRIRPGLPGFALTDLLVASRDGREVYVFSEYGKHLRTVDALLGITLYSFEYDELGALISVTDREGDATRLERDAEGQLTAFVGPDGERTEVTLDENGYLASLTNAEGETTSLEHTETGLLTRLARPRGDDDDVHHFEYDAGGRLIRDEGPTGLAQELDGRRTATGREVTLTQNGTRAHTYAITRADEIGLITRTQTDARGLVTESRDGPTGWTRVSPTMRETGTLTGDPRFGLQSSYPSSQLTELSGTHDLEQLQTRSVTLADPLNPLSVSTLTDALTVNDRTTTRVWSTEARTWTTTTPEQRQLVVTLDELGRVESSQLGELEPETRAYDDEGRLIEVTRGERTYALEYEDGRISAVVDPLGQRTEWQRDAVGRITSLQLPDDSTLTLGYDAAGSLTAVTPPGRPAHTFEYEAGGLLASYAAPTVSGVSSPALEVEHDDFDQVLSTSWPNADSVSMTYADDSGVLVSVALPNETIDYGYDAASGQLVSATRGAEALTLNYTGSLLASMRYNGTIDGTVSFGYDDAGRLIRDRFGTTVEFAYDDDDLLITAGAEQITRDPETGLVAATQLETVAESLGYNAYGELVEHVVNAGASELYARDETRDALGRVVARTETVLGETTELEYEYDARGRLIAVTTDGLSTTSYAYDGNGNRLSLTRGGATVLASYDAQDRLIAHGALSFVHDARGNLIERADGDDVTSYSYDALGALRSVTLPDARVIEYIVDASGRRIGKRVDGEIVQELLYRSDLAPIAERDENGDVARFVYASHVNVPDYMEKGGLRYRLVTDQLGSVRLVVNATTGEVAQRIDYDEFGRVLSDTSPGFQPFGFAGGLYDADTGLVRFGARDYDAETGRWTAKDPTLFAGGTANLYGYAHGDPVNYLDPQGEIAFFAAALCLGGGCEAAASAALWGAAFLTAGLLGAALAQADIAQGWDRVFSDNAAEKRLLKELGRRLGKSVQELSEALHKIKQAAGIRGRSVDIAPDGTVTDPISGEDIGNICDG